MMEANMNKPSRVVLTILMTGISAVLFVMVASSKQAELIKWDVPVQISDTEGNSGGPRLVVDSHDTVHLIWYDWIDLVSHPPYLQYSAMDSSGEWSAPEFIKAGSWPLQGYYGSNIGVVASPDGGLHMVWEHYRYDNGDDTISYIRRDVNGNWSDVEEVPHQKNWPAASQPDISLGLDGTVHVVYQDWEGPGHQKTIQHVMRMPTGVWTSMLQVTPVEGDYVYPMLAVDDEGTAHLVYTKISSGHNEFFTASKKPGENWTGPMNMNVAPTSENSVEQLTSGANGRIHLVWTEWEQNVFPWNCTVMYAEKFRSGGWSVPRSLAHHCATQVAVAADRFGRAHVAWHYDGKLWYAYQDPEGSFTYPSIAEDTDPYHQFPVDLSIAVDLQGERHVAWNSNHDGNIWSTCITGMISVDSVITETGGSVYAFSGDSLADFPPGAVSQEVIVTHTPQSASSLSINMKAITAFDLTAESAGSRLPVTSFDKPYTVTTYYTDAEITGLKEESLALHWWNNSTWEKLSTSLVDTANNQVSASLDHMTQFVLIGESVETWQYLNLPLVMLGQ
jgi:hypothetical protein